MNKENFRLSLTVITTLLIVLIAAVTGGGLLLLRRMHRELAHATATQTVLDTGSRIVGYLANQEGLAEMAENPDTAAGLSPLVHALHAVENDLHYVSILRDGVTVFHEPTVPLEQAILPTAAPPLPTPPAHVRISRRIMHVGNEAIPVVVFRLDQEDAEGRTVAFEVGLLRAAVIREEGAAAAAIASMFTLTMATLVTAFALCVILVIWMMRRETVREQQRRQQEHLAFSGVLANGIVHDFRNPMSSLRLDVQMLEKEAKRADARPERLGQLAGRIRTTLDRMDKVFQEFLYLARPSDSAPSPLSVNRCIQDCIEVVSPRLEHAGVTVQEALADPAVSVLAYPSAIKRALINLLINAEQASTTGQTISVRAGVSGHGHDRAGWMEVADQGPGIPREKRRHIFDMFVSTRPGGTGLGLFLARTAVEKSGGTITVTQPETGGACFRITLPLTEENLET